MSRSSSVTLILLLATGSVAAESKSTECQQRLSTSTAIRDEILKHGARAVTSDWINRLRVARDWDCLLDAIGSADRGWLEVGSLLWPVPDGVTGSDLMRAFAMAMDTNPEATLRHFKRHAALGLETACIADTLPIGRSKEDLHQLWARRRNRVRQVTAPELKPFVDRCLSYIDLGEGKVPYEGE